jgi:hypothetical protein
MRLHRKYRLPVCKIGCKELRVTGATFDQARLDNTTIGDMSDVISS